MACSRAAALLILWLVAGCGGDRICLSGPCPQQSKACKDYVDCFVATGGLRESLASSYGPNGTCWRTNRAAAVACTDACTNTLPALKSAFPDAGCH